MGALIKIYIYVFTKGGFFGIHPETCIYNTTVLALGGLRLCKGPQDHSNSYRYYMGHFTELVQSQVGNILKFFMFYSQNFVPIYILYHIKYTYLVNEPSIFILYFQNVLECFSSS